MNGSDQQRTASAVIEKRDAKSYAAETEFNNDLHNIQADGQRNRPPCCVIVWHQQYSSRGDKLVSIIGQSGSKWHRGNISGLQRYDHEFDRCRSVFEYSKFNV